MGSGSARAGLQESKRRALDSPAWEVLESAKIPMQIEATAAGRKEFQLDMSIP
jgi:hypothetical protein